MAKVLLSTGIQFKAASNATILGATGSEIVTLLNGSSVTVDSNVDKFVLTGSSSDYTYKATTTGLQILKAGFAIANVGNGTTLVFSNGSALVSTGLDAGAVVVRLGGVLVPSAASSLTPTLTANGSLSTSDASANAKVVLSSSDSYTAASNSVVYGTTSSQTVSVQDGALVSVDANVERVNFTGATTDYTYKAITTGLQVLKAGVAIANVSNGATLAFSNGSAVVATQFLSGAVVVTLGSTVVSNAATSITPSVFNAADKSTGVTGSVIDGYVAGATIFVDANGDGVLNEGEVSTQTDANGNYTLPVGSGSVTAFGGVDLLTGQAFQGVMTAPAGSSSVSPLTTLVQSAISSGQSETQAKASVAAALGLPAGVDVTTYDPIAALASSATDATALAVQKAAQQVISIITQATAAIAAGNTDTTQTTVDIAAQVSKAITAAISSNTTGGTLDLTSASMITNVVSQAATATGVQSVVDNAAKIASVTASSNTQIKASTDLTSLVKAAVVSQVDAVNTLTTAITNNTIDAATTQFTSTITTLIDNASTGGSLTTDAKIDTVVTTRWYWSSTNRYPR